MIAAALLGGWVWAWGLPWLRAADGSTGVAVVSSEAGAVLGWVVLLLSGGVAIALAAGVGAATRNRLAGVFTLAAAGLMLAVWGGPIHGWMWRSSLPGGYGWLAAEAVVWALGLAGFFGGQALLEARLPDASARQASPQRRHETDTPEEAWWLVPASGVLAAAVGGVLTHFFVTREDVGQVVGALILAFAIAAGVSQVVTRVHRSTGLLLAPLLAAIGGYLWTAWSYPSHDAVLAAWYGGEITGLSLGLPIFYATAGTLGAVLGTGLGRHVADAMTEEDDAEEAAVVPPRMAG